MADQHPPQTSGLQISADVAQKFGPLLALIKGSESMNDEERQYWINILPVMTPDQVKNLEEILVNEKNQLAAIDAKYSKQTNAEDEKRQIARIDEERRKKRQERSGKEAKDSREEETSEEELLKQIEGL